MACVCCSCQNVRSLTQIGPGEKPQRLDLPTQAQTVTRGSEPSPRGVALEERDDDKKKVSDLDYLSELLAIQQSGPKV